MTQSQLPDAAQQARTAAVKAVKSGAARRIRLSLDKLRRRIHLHEDQERFRDQFSRTQAEASRSLRRQVYGQVMEDLTARIIRQVEEEAGDRLQELNARLNEARLRLHRAQRVFVLLLLAVVLAMGCGYFYMLYRMHEIQEELLDLWRSQIVAERAQTTRSLELMERMFEEDTEEKQP